MSAARGKAYIVGAGPGDPGLITVKGLEALQRADVVIYDRLINPYLLAQAPTGAEWVYAGKGTSGNALDQDEIDRLLGYNRFTVTPRRGELIVFDKLARRLVSHILLPVPTSITKGVLISPTVFGNVLLGPTAEDLPDKSDTATSAAGLHMLLDKGKAIMTQLLDEEVTAVYAGLRPATEHKDYQIFVHPAERYICVGGIRSTGVSASLGIAEYVVELLATA